MQQQPDSFHLTAHSAEASTVSEASSVSGRSDPLYAEAVALVRKHKRGSVSLVQRHLQIGYNRAHSLIDAMVGTVITNMPPVGKIIPEAGESTNDQEPK